MAEKRDYSEITPEIQALAAHCSEDCVIDKELYTKYKVNRGLRERRTQIHMLKMKRGSRYRSDNTKNKGGRQWR